MKKNNIQLGLEVSTKALIAAIPFVGGSLNSLLADYLQERQAKRLNEFIEGLKDDLQEKIDQIDSTKINTEDFEDIFENSLREILKTRHEAKRLALRNILYNTITREDVSLDEAEYLSGLITQLPINHLYILLRLSHIVVVENKESENSEKNLKNLSKETSLSEEVVLEILQDLENENLVKGFIGHYSSRNGMGGIILSGMSSYLTDKGIRLMQMIAKE